MLPQLDTVKGCIWPEQLGLRISRDAPLGGTAILQELAPQTLGKTAQEGSAYYRVANTSLILLLEGDAFVVRDMFYLDP